MTASVRALLSVWGLASMPGSNARWTCGGGLVGKVCLTAAFLGINFALLLLSTAGLGPARRPGPRRTFFGWNGCTPSR